MEARAEDAKWAGETAAWGGPRAGARARRGGPTSRPHPATQIASDHRAEFARCLEPLLLLGPRRAAGAGGGTST